jgi:hypothetical protein
MSSYLNNCHEEEANGQVKQQQNGNGEVSSVPIWAKPYLPPVPTKITVPALHQMKANGTRIAALTAYDYTMAVQVGKG